MLPSGTLTQVDILYSTPTCRIGVSRNLLVYAWYDAPTVADLRECGRFARAAARQHPAGTALLDLIVGGTPRFSEEVRQETARITSDPTTVLLGSAEVVLLGGFAGTAVRAFIGTANLVGRAPRPQKVFGDVVSAAAWLAPKLCAGGERWTPADVVAVTPQFLAPPPPAARSPFLSRPGAQ